MLYLTLYYLYKTKTNYWLECAKPMREVDEVRGKECDYVNLNIRSGLYISTVPQSKNWGCQSVPSWWHEYEWHIPNAVSQEYLKVAWVYMMRVLGKPLKDGVSVYGPNGHLRDIGCACYWCQASHGCLLFLLPSTHHPTSNNGANPLVQSTGSFNYT